MNCCTYLHSCSDCYLFALSLYKSKFQRQPGFATINRPEEISYFRKLSHQVLFQVRQSLFYGNVIVIISYSKVYIITIFCLLSLSETFDLLSARRLRSTKVISNERRRSVPSRGPFLELKPRRQVHVAKNNTIVGDGELFGLVKPFLVYLYQKTRNCIRLKLLV